jgi:hypothetical protein
MVNGEGAPVKQSELAKALGLSPQAIVKLKRQGMPTDTVEAAQAWRRDHVRPYAAARPPAALVAVAELGERVDALLEAGQAAPVESLRAAVLAVPDHLRASVRLSVRAWDALTGWPQ